MQFFKRRLILVYGVVLALAAAFIGFMAYQNHAREKQNQEILGIYKHRSEQQRKINEVMKTRRERVLMKKSRPPIQRPRSSESPSH
jgi:hypothetical protein